MELVLNRQEVCAWLSCESEEKIRGDLMYLGQHVQLNTKGMAVHLRGLVEVSNRCRRQCAYCGLRAANGALERYALSDEEILACAQRIAERRWGTIVLQGGEDGASSAERVARLVKTIKERHDLAVTLSLGERPIEDYALWRQAGADRYLLRFETSDEALFQRIHPPAAGSNLPSRLHILRELRLMGYEVGSGFLVGLPGQSLRSLADDLLLAQSLELDMVGIGPYIAHPDTPLSRGLDAQGEPLPLLSASDSEYVPSSGPRQEQLVYICLALLRLLLPQANLPATTALATVNKDQGLLRGLQCGANVIMPNVTPYDKRLLYAIYPGKDIVDETPLQKEMALQEQLKSVGRFISYDRGNARS